MSSVLSLITMLTGGDSGSFGLVLSVVAGATGAATNWTSVSQVNGGTARATVELDKQLGGKDEGVAVLIELFELNGRERLKGEALFALLQY